MTSSSDSGPQILYSRKGKDVILRKFENNAYKA